MMYEKQFVIGCTFLTLQLKAIEMFFFFQSLSSKPKMALTFSKWVFLPTHWAKNQKTKITTAVINWQDLNELSDSAGAVT